MMRRGDDGAHGVGQAPWRRTAAGHDERVAAIQVVLLLRFLAFCLCCSLLRLSRAFQARFKRMGGRGPHIAECSLARGLYDNGGCPILLFLALHKPEQREPRRGTARARQAGRR